MSNQIEENWVKYMCTHEGCVCTSKPNVNMVCSHTNQDGKRKLSFPMLPFDFILEKCPKEILNLVSSRDYLNTLILESDKLIVGEKSSKRALITLILGGRLVKNAKTTSYNVMLSALSGSGKDYLALNILKLMPQGLWDHKTRLSEKALSYWHPSELEPYFSWNGRVLYCEDISNSFLNSDTTKIMMTGGSDISIVSDGSLKTLKVNGSPIFVLTSATAEPNKELSRRVSLLSTDISEEQTSKILEFQKNVAVNGYPTYTTLVTYATYALRRVEVSIPFASVFLEKFPKKLSARTNFDRLLDIVKAITALHQYSRKKDSLNRVIAELDDLKIALEVFKVLFPNRSLSLPFSQQSIVNYLQQIKVKKTASELFREVGVNHYSQLGTMIEGLRSLVAKGLIDMSEGVHVGKLCDFYSYLPEIEDSSLFDLTNLTDLSSITNLTNLTKGTESKPESYGGQTSNSNEKT